VVRVLQVWLREVQDLLVVAAVLLHLEEMGLTLQLAQYQLVAQVMEQTVVAGARESAVTATPEWVALAVTAV
jgi:hypothetical protein